MPDKLTRSSVKTLKPENDRGFVDDIFLNIVFNFDEISRKFVSKEPDCE